MRALLATYELPTLGSVRSDCMRDLEVLVAEEREAEEELGEGGGDEEGVGNKALEQVLVMSPME